MSKTAIIILSDPKGGEDALGRAFNALFLAFQLKQKDQPFEIIFQGAGARWPAEFVKSDNPANGLYEALKGNIKGVCGGCADVFGATEAVSGTTDLELLRQVEIPGVGSITDLTQFIDDDVRVVTF